MRRFLFAAMAGVTAGYAAYRSYEAARGLRGHAPPLPQDADAYGELRRRLEIGGLLRSLAGSAAFAAGGYGRLLTRATSGVPVALRPAVFAAASLFADAALELPAAYVEGHEHERRYGLTDQSPQSWLADHLKGTLIGTGVAVLLSIPFAALLRKRPNDWPIFATAGLAPLFVLAGVIVPVYLAPLFNKFEPLEGPLEERLRKLAARYGVGDAQILRVDMSKQTKKANAYVTGLFNTHRIVIGDTLLQNFSDAEIEFVVAHELGHYVSRDSWRMVGVGVAAAGATFALANLMMPASKRARYDDPAVLYELYVRLLYCSALLRPAAFAFSRSREWAADRFALRATQDGATGAAAFRRLRRQNLAQDDVPKWYELVFSTHPPLGARIAKLEQS
jgi:STE24 endopeptidase